MSPSAKSTKHLRELGYIVANVEKWVPGANVRRDAYGFGDLLIAGHGCIALVQVTTTAHQAARETKIRSLPEFPEWCAAGGVVFVHGWNGNTLTVRQVRP